MSLSLLNSGILCLLPAVKGVNMLSVNKYKDVLLKEFSLDSDGSTIRRATDGWRGKWKKGDVATGYKLCSYGYEALHIPRTRASVNVSHLVMLLNGVEIPDDHVVDHIDGNSTNNKISNLRLVPQKINCRNSRQRKNNTTGHNGITWNKASNSYIVRLYINGIRKYLGQRATLEEAVELRDSVKKDRIQDGYTERHGLERATTIPQGSTLQAIGSGSA